MRSLKTSALCLISLIAPAFAQQPTQIEVQAAAQRLKAAKIERFLKKCAGWPAVKESCPSILESLESREKKVIVSLIPYIRSPKVNERQFTREFNQCHDTRFGFDEYVICIEHFVERVADAERGQFIFNR